MGPTTEPRRAAYQGRERRPNDVSVLFEESRVASLPQDHRLADARPRSPDARAYGTWGSATGARAAGSPWGVSASDLADEVLQDASRLFAAADRGFCELRDVLGAADTRREPPDPRTPFEGILSRSARGEFLSITASSAARLSGVRGLVPVEIRDAAPATACVAVRRPDPFAEAFRRTALDIARELLPLVPEARRPGTWA